jgi:hypothetical protein
MEYFGNRYAEYNPVLPSKIIHSLSNFSYERQIPSLGLTAENEKRILESYSVPFSTFDIYLNNLKGEF